MAMSSHGCSVLLRADEPASAAWSIGGVLHTLPAAWCAAGLHKFARSHCLVARTDQDHAVWCLHALLHARTICVSQICWPCVAHTLVCWRWWWLACHAANLCMAVSPCAQALLRSCSFGRVGVVHQDAIRTLGMGRISGVPCVLCGG